MTCFRDSLSASVSLDEKFSLIMSVEISVLFSILSIESFLRIFESFELHARALAYCARVATVANVNDFFGEAVLPFFREATSQTANYCNNKNNNNNTNININSPSQPKEQSDATITQQEQCSL